MSLTDSMQTLKNEIKASRGKRDKDLKDIKQATSRVQQDARKTIAGFEKTRQEGVENLNRDLASFTKNLSQDVGNLRRRSRQDLAGVREDVLSASRIWRGKASATKKPEAKGDGGEE